MEKNTDRIAQLFRHLDQWRHYPAYQLERRVDIFFSLYLRDVVKSKVDVDLAEEIIPELPLKGKLVGAPKATESSSVKVDYALFSQNRQTVFLVELKTDRTSRSDRQDRYLAAAGRMRFSSIVQGILDIARKTKAPHKYHHLLAALDRLGFLSMRDEIRAHFYDRAVRPEFSKLFAAIEPARRNPGIEIVYVQPDDPEKESAKGKEKKIHSVDFEYFASHVSQFHDPVSQAFAHHLRKWITKAASQSPVGPVES